MPLSDIFQWETQREVGYAVRPSVTCRYCVETANRTIEVLLFRLIAPLFQFSHTAAQTRLRNSDGPPTT